MSVPPEPEPAPAASSLEHRTLQLRAGLSAAATVVLLVGAGLALAANLVFFGVLLVVVAVFAAVDLQWVLRRLRRGRGEV